MNKYLVLYQQKGERFATFMNQAFLCEADDRDHAIEQCWNFLNDDREKWEIVDVYRRDEPMPIPRVVLHIDGGAWHDSTSNMPLELMVIDYDCDTVEKDRLTTVDVGEGMTETAIVHRYAPERNPDYTNGRFAKFIETEGREC